MKMDISFTRKDIYMIYLKKYNIKESKPVRCLKPIENKRLRQIKFNKTIYQSAIGSLLYLAINTRPDILFSVSKAARKTQNLTNEDWENIIKIFRYLRYYYKLRNKIYKKYKNSNLSRCRLCWRYYNKKVYLRIPNKNWRLSNKLVF